MIPMTTLAITSHTNISLHTDSILPTRIGEVTQPDHCLTTISQEPIKTLTPEVVHKVDARALKVARIHCTFVNIIFTMTTSVPWK